MKKEDLLLEIEELKSENGRLREQLKKNKEDFDFALKNYNEEMDKINFERFARLNVYYIRKHGIFNYIGKVFQSIFKVIGLFFKRLGKKIKARKTKKELKKILNSHKGKEIMVFYPGYDWYMQMYQRPQHMAIHFAKKDILFFYCTINANDRVEGFEKITDNLYVTNMFEYLKKKLPKYTLYMCANMNGCYLKELKQIEKKGNDILYEYIDDLHEDLTSISNELIERHKYALSNENIKVVATAEHLYNKALQYRKDNILLSTNGVVYEDFHITKKLSVPDKIKDLVKENKPIIGYYGALAKWFDYELIERLATKMKNVNILLIGIDYDDSLARYNYFKSFKNVYYIGPVNYKELVNYGYYCSVLTIPFVINEITLSTSPVKVFEYMSMEKPIVTTDLPECRKYESVMISKNHQEFIDNVKKALTLSNDKKYKELLRRDALNNTWDKKVEEILNFKEKSE